MILSGVTFNTGTSALACAINYPHQGLSPRVRLSPEVHDRSKPIDLEKHDELLILGRNAEDARHGFNVLAQIHTDQVAPLTATSTTKAIQLQPFNLVEWDGKSNFSAYIEADSNPMFE